MNKKEFAAIMAERMDTTKKLATETVETALDIISNALASGEDVSLYGFGNFKLKKRKAYTARNPATGEPVEVAEKTVVGFKPAKALKEKVL